MKKKTVRTVRTTEGLCDALFDEFDMLRNGESDAHRAGAVSKLVVQIINTKRLEIDAANAIRGGLKVGSIIFDADQLRLGGK